MYLLHKSIFVNFIHFERNTYTKLNILTKLHLFSIIVKITIIEVVYYLVKLKN